MRAFVYYSLAFKSFSKSARNNSAHSYTRIISHIIASRSSSVNSYKRMSRRTVSDPERGSCAPRSRRSIDSREIFARRSTSLTEKPSRILRARKICPTMPSCFFMLDRLSDCSWKKSSWSSPKYAYALPSVDMWMVSPSSYKSILLSAYSPTPRARMARWRPYDWTNCLMVSIIFGIRNF